LSFKSTIHEPYINHISIKRNYAFAEGLGFPKVGGYLDWTGKKVESRLKAGKEVFV
jgi:hypothetical protein